MSYAELFYCQFSCKLKKKQLKKAFRELFKNICCQQNIFLQNCNYLFGLINKIINKTKRFSFTNTTVNFCCLCRSCWQNLTEKSVFLL